MSATIHSVLPSNSTKAKRRTKTPAAKTSRQQNTVRRATVSLSAHSSEIVERFKSATGMSTSRAIEELILRSEPREPRIKRMNGRAVIDLPIEKGSITTEQILQLEDESW
jgi:hypothetical protein